MCVLMCSIAESSSSVVRGVAWSMLFLRCLVAATMQSVGVGEGRQTVWLSNWMVSDLCKAPVSFMTTS